MATQHLVVVGASSGGIEALRDLVQGLPAEFPAPIAIVLHTSPESPAILHDMLSRWGPLAGIHPRDGERLQPGRIYVAPPDYHLLVEPGRLRVAKGPRENRFRPAIDPLFRSAAQVFGPAAIGVILTGNLDDGAAGLWAVKQLGGIAIVQDPATAMFPSMPESALRAVDADYVVPLREIAPLLVRLTARDTAARVPAATPGLDVEIRIAKHEDPMKAGVQELGTPSRVACPECHGVLLELTEGDRIRFRCHTGHAYSVESLLAEIDGSVEVALWNAIRSMHEGSMLMRRMIEHAELSHPGTSADTLRARVQELDRQADSLRMLIADAAPVMRDDP